MANPMPAVFIGHGNPMNTLLDNAYTRGWAAIGKVGGWTTGHGRCFAICFPGPISRWCGSASTNGNRRNTTSNSGNGSPRYATKEF